MSEDIAFLLNGRPVTLDGDPGRSLLWVVRDELGFTGTKYGCGVGRCGACTVLVDGVATRSCVTPLAAASGAEVTTVEGLARGDGSGGEVLHPVQRAFLDEQVPQCGWCMNGQMMTAVAFLAANPAPDEAAIDAALANNLCRCGCYVRIRRAVARAAEDGRPA